MVERSNNLKRSAIKLLTTTDTQATEVYLAMLKILWGIAVFLPTTTSSATIASQIVPVWLFGLVLLSVGLVRIYAVVADNRNLRKAGAFLSVGLWSFVLVATLLANAFSITAGVLLFALFLTFSVWVTLRLRH